MKGIRSLQIAAVAGSAAAAAAAAPSVASLGSSYSAGYGLKDSYGKLLADLLSESTGETAIYDNFAVSGSNVTAIASSQAAKLGGKQYDVVVITAGGNDLNYVTCLFGPSLSYCGNTISETEYVKRYTDGLTSTVQNLGNATEVPIYVVTYTQAIGSNTVCGERETDCPLTPAQVQTAQGLYNKVIDWTLKAVSTWTAAAENQAYKLRVIPMEIYSSDRHNVDSCEPWINGAISRSAEGDGANWHPNEDGSQFIAQAVFNDLHGLDSPLY